MKTIMIIDGAENCAYDCFSADEALFNFIFPENGQNIEFFEDIQKRGISEEWERKFSEMWKRPVPKKAIRGLDGILFYELGYKKRFYPGKKDTDLDAGSRAFSMVELEKQYL